MTQVPKTCLENDKPFSVRNINSIDNINNYITQSDLDRKITETSPFNESDNRNPFNDDLIRCYVLNPQENTFGIRVNTILSYCTINQKVTFLIESIHKILLVLYKKH